MKFSYSLLLILAIGFASCANNKKKTPNENKYEFPQDWYGYYEGSLELWNAEKGKHMELPMSLEIAKTKDKNRTHYYSSSIYQGKEIIKDYHIIKNDTLRKNHFLMDENNGIYLDMFLMDDAFYDYFEVNGLGLYGITRRVPKGIEFEIASFQLKSVSYSYFNGADFQVDSVGSYKVVNTQKVLLKKTKKKKKKK